MYKIIGANKAEYGPVSVEQLRQWIAEGRVDAQTLAQAAGETGWKPIASYADFAASFPSVSNPPPLPPGTPPSFVPSTPPPLSPGISRGDGRLRALEAVNGPAIGMIVIGALIIAHGLFRLLVHLAGISLGNLNQWQSMNFPGQSAEMIRSIQLGSGILGISLTGVMIGLGVLILFGGVKMKRLESHGLCSVACVITFIPCVYPCCCFVGLPIGIWALIVLNKPEVRDFFT